MSSRSILLAPRGSLTLPDNRPIGPLPFSMLSLNRKSLLRTKHGQNVGLGQCKTPIRQDLLSGIRAVRERNKDDKRLIENPTGLQSRL